MQRDFNRWDKATPEQRFWPKVNKDGPIPSHCPELGPCWIWTRGLGSGGYGQFWWTELKRTITAHRAAWIITNGPIPKGIDACHHCDNPPCVRPAHLFLGTNQENQLDASRKGISSAAQARWRSRHPDRPATGERHGMAKLTANQVREIRTQHSSGFSLSQIARDYGVSVGTIWFIIAGVHWKSVK